MDNPYDPPPLSLRLYNEQAPQETVIWFSQTHEGLGEDYLLTLWFVVKVTGHKMCPDSLT